MSPASPVALPESPESTLSGSLPADADAAPGSGQRGLWEGAQEEGAQDAPAQAPVARPLDDTQVADWLHAHPEFFDQHADLLAEVRLRHPHGGRAISLVERQVLVLRERNKALEARLADLIRIGQDNDAIVNRLQQLTGTLLRVTDPASLPAIVADGLRERFSVPQVAVRLWGVAAVAAPYGDEVSAGMQRMIEEMTQPYCGPASHPEAISWLPAAAVPGDGPDAAPGPQADAALQTGSLALLPLRLEVDGRPRTFGVLALGSPDAGRFQAGMGTAFLEGIAEVASASLSRLF
ncbi:MAG: DUF484 family protein [Burkholderiaceae bacterium]|nr:DUF484 family protein [Burkholderiaceae bacterium]